MIEAPRALRPHPTRDQIVDLLRAYEQPISPTQISRALGLSMGSAAYHVRTLVDAGMVDLVDEGRVRGAVEHFYQLRATHQDVPLTDPAKALLSLCGALTVPDPSGGFPRSTVLDERARKALDRLLRTVEPQVREIALASTARAAA